MDLTTYEEALAAAKAKGFDMGEGVGGALREAFAQIALEGARAALDVVMQREFSRERPSGNPAQDPIPAV